MPRPRCHPRGRGTAVICGHGAVAWGGALARETPVPSSGTAPFSLAQGTPQSRTGSATIDVALLLHSPRCRSVPRRGGDGMAGDSGGSGAPRSAGGARTPLPRPLNLARRSHRAVWCAFQGGRGRQEASIVIVGLLNLVRRGRGGGGGGGGGFDLAHGPRPANARSGDRRAGRPARTFSGRLQHRRALGAVDDRPPVPKPSRLAPAAFRSIGAA